MNEKKKMSLATKIFIALVLGIAAGMALTNHISIAVEYIKPFGTIFLNLIKWIVTPLVFFSIMSGVISMRDIKKVGSVGVKTIVYYLCTTAFAITIGLILANLFKGIFPVLQATDLAFAELSEEAASVIEPKVHVVTDLINEMTRNHFKRMSAGECSLLADAVFSNLMAEYKRIAGTCSNTGMATLVRIHPELASKEHLFLETLDENGSAEYKAVLEQTRRRYFDQLSAAEAGSPAAPAEAQPSET